jgi:hypothetical protein
VGKYDIHHPNGYTKSASIACVSRALLRHIFSVEGLKTPYIIGPETHRHFKDFAAPQIAPTASYTPQKC